MNLLWLLIFWTMQASASVFFKYGSTSDARWLPCFIGGNIIGASSIWFLMLLYKTMNPNVAMGLGAGGGFLVAQIALAVVFHSQLSFLQYGGLLAITAGMFFLSMGGNVAQERGVSDVREPERGKGAWRGDGKGTVLP